MRRLLCATALSGALLVLGACSSGKSAETTGGATPPSTAAAPGASGGPAPGGASPAGGDVALKGNTKAICDQAARTGAEAAQKFALDLKLLIEAETSQDASAVTKAKAKTDRDVQNYSSALADMAKLASEPEVKKALTDMGKQVAALQGDVRKLDARKLAGLQETLARACGTA
ncbi:hypothetical protein [Couchioplanes azureus]|uniref:hypothetical protein n=1 Tax=Couchioplanes caeruleus TaxID=56438 RepID=UPI0016709C83|nr:hypothetical protein [Couchioplanes caeruleus]GGQ80421.1 hypothetical protein GCM10010166_58260 [Couchioplanes caeruleus subsp. azureus]